MLDVRHYQVIVNGERVWQGYTYLMAESQFYLYANAGRSVEILERTTVDGRINREVDLTLC